MLIGYAIGLYFGDPLTFMLLGLVFAAVLNFATYFWSDKIVVRMARARIIQEEENPTLFDIVRKVSQEAGIPMPKVGIVNSPMPNAFATGRGPHKAVVVATNGILNTLTPTELEAVIGHEIGHVVHRDVLISSVAATIAGVISYIRQHCLMVHDVWRSRKRPTKQRKHRCIITGSCIRSSWSNLRTIGDQSKLRVQCRRVRGQNNPQPRRINQRAGEDLKQSKLALCPRSNSWFDICFDRVSLDRQPDSWTHIDGALLHPSLN